MPHNEKNTAKVQITEISDGLELRSTSWYEIDAKGKELVCDFEDEPEYEFIEDYSEVKQVRVNEIDRQIKQVVEHVIILKKRDSIDKS